MSTSTTSTNGNGSGFDGHKVPSSITRVYDIPVVKETVTYADSLLKSYSLSAAAYRSAEAVAATVYRKAGEPIQDRLQPQIDQLDGLANKTLDFVQNKAPFLFETKTDDIVATARKPADQAYSTAKGYQNHAVSTAKSYQDLVSNRLHDTLVSSQQTLGGLQERLGAAAAHVPKNGKEAQDAAHALYENLEKIKDQVLKQSGELPANVSNAVQPYIEKLQKGAGDVKSELNKEGVPAHQKAQHIIAITKDITTEYLSDAIETLRTYTQRSKATANDSTSKIQDTVQEGAQNAKKTAEEGVSKAKKSAEEGTESAKKTASEGVEKAQSTGKDAVQSSEQFVDENTPGDVSYADSVKDGDFEFRYVGPERSL